MRPGWGQTDKAGPMPRLVGVSGRGFIAAFGMVLWLGSWACTSRPAASSPTPGAGSRGASQAALGEPSFTELPPSQGATELCRNAIDDNDNQLIDEGCNEPQGDVFFALAWSEPRAKLDLLVVGPDGDLAPVGRISSLGLVRSRDCPGQDRECEGVNYESVVLEGEKRVKGTFVVRVRYEGTEPAEDVVRAQLGARISGKSHAYALTFSRAGTELALPFVAESGP
jgi:hypothetical protein